jgi:hypothetical protein
VIIMIFEICAWFVCLLAWVALGWAGYGAGGRVEHLLAMGLRSLHTVHRVDRLNRQLEQHVLELLPINSLKYRTLSTVSKSD